jgi:FkbM family methyltransferase
MEEFGLKRGSNGLEIYVMCEIPSNVILAEEFAKIFDGFSIGSNDLTQLTLGIDRDSDIVNNLFDERNEAAKWMIATAIQKAKKANVKILNYAVGNKNGMIDINISNLSDSSSLLFPTKLQLKTFPGTFIVQKSSARIKKLKNFTANIKKPIFLKIDVQGYELEVLKGSNLRHIKYISRRFLC